ncbi:hypothetical protein B9Q01_01850 [Candidatus Marsarchaeota G1 archaeon OSP_D]|jgi:Predicted transcriptional regulator|uniref:ArnR1-like winged helix-turn-helix domain-containing protein n=3 Tax=Candidatus Marsarchaeota group 1 TaxID=2203770 RepID=A0A2R6AJF4_9ARCH|nr:MAG: hypothetical protein B9Q01_01850 [Candidatus Marsarchaeota G1 archaeon OSP_D]PSN86510.1 MAG: hypothetical protein B9Q02_02025 [Candidatus Marsarchaeota G1 archaeon BE_D]PSN89205.1 MAG: hypothetical protein B9Q00_02315 [Candidatus Marsarchaeota G1 archaeon OSP_C]
MSREKYRSRISIIVDVLKAIGEEGKDQKLTHILSKANIPYSRLTSLLEELEKLEFIKSVENENKRVYVLTQKGRKYIAEYEKFKRFSEAFGLRI